MFFKTIWSLLFISSSLHFANQFGLAQDLGCPRECHCSFSNMIRVYCGHEGGFDRLTEFPSFIPFRVKTLSLYNNMLSSIPVDALGNLTHLTHLNLGSNQLRDVPGTAFRDLVALESLNARRNKLSTLPARLFSGLIKLQELSLDDNEIASIPDALFQDLPSLRRLNLQNNKLKAFPETGLRGTLSLQGLFLTNNALTHISESTFANLSSVRQLILSNNRISTIPLNVFRGLRSLILLGLDNNNISLLPDRVFDGLKPGIKVLLSGNPFHCNCELRWLKDWLESRTRYIHSSGVRLRTTCSRPALLQGKPIIDVEDEQFTCFDGQWGDWGPWNACSTTCGRGTQISIRRCTNPSTGRGEEGCQGSNIKYKSCRSVECRASWTAWSQWSSCSRTCSVGKQARRRSCRPSHSKRSSSNSCVGNSLENRSCNNRPCSIDGVWGSWSKWSSCTVTCSLGKRVRVRSCDSPTPQNGGKPCPGDKEWTEICYLGSCPVNGGWSTWSTWSSCSATCFNGTKMRQRSCNKPIPQYGGNGCDGNSIQVINCNTDQCPIDGTWTAWSDWTECSVTCSNGAQIRFRACSNPAPQFGGQNCSGNSSDIKDCNLGPCPVNGNWTVWSQWSECSKTCSNGTRSRNRTCSNPSPQFGGTNCSGEISEIEKCNLGPCPIHGQWDVWSEWSDCSHSCSGGTRSRARTCSNPFPSNGGKNCSGNSSKVEICNLQPCPVHGGWTEWSSWSDCSRTCSNGTITRFRNCTNPSPKHQGKECSGDSVATIHCSQKPCSLNGEWTEWSQWTSCSVACLNKTRTRSRTCIIIETGLVCKGHSREEESCGLSKACALSVWSGWTECSKTCGSGTRTRLRTCQNAATSGSSNPKCSENITETMSCDAGPCFTEWSNWTDCSKTCDVGQQTRIRSCDNLNNNSSNLCTGNATEMRACFRGPCTNGWNEWQSWSPCSVSCGPGNQLRSRNCSRNEDSPEKICVGPSVQNKSCFLEECPVRGRWNDWSNWTACSSSCGRGVQARFRSCTNPRPQRGGDDCKGKNVEYRECKNAECKDKQDHNDSFWSSWSPWSECSATCSSGYQTRSRYCRKQSSVFHLGNCSNFTGPIHVENKVCEVKPCTFSATWTRWSAWEDCSQTCGGGIRKRVRYCISLAVAVNCTGDNFEVISCSTNPCPTSPLVTYPPRITLGLPNPCPDPEKPVNGGYKMIDQDGSYYVQHYCRKHFYVHGPRLRHCERDNSWSDYVAYCLPVCGESSFAAEDAQRRRLRIFGGTTSLPGLWPWQVALEVNNKFHCGGSLIAESWVVTAAHCVYGRGTKIIYPYIRVYLGVHDITSRHTDPHVQRIDSAEVVPHPNFNWKTYDSDIALIKLSWKANITDYVRPVCLPSKQQRRRIIPGAMGVMLGWGMTEGKNLATKLREVHMPVVGHSNCQKAYKNQTWPVTSNMVCAGYKDNDKDSCRQDSGGGFLFSHSNGRKKKWFLGGIISWGNPQCGTPGKYSVFTHINSRFSKWIKNYIYS